MRLFRSFAGIAVCIAAAVVPVLAQSSNDPQPQWQDLADEPSRSQLSGYEMLRFASPGEKTVRRSFIFPNDAGDAEYGVDVSHHNGVVDWTELASRNVKFAYIKATQGTNFRDPTFTRNWAGAAVMRRGAYHFLSARAGTGKQQAVSFLALLQATGGLRPEDLAPVLDMEWDMVTASGNPTDRWASFSPDQIAVEATAWLTEVERVTGRRPIIYTAASWWNPRLKSNTSLRRYTHWIADYRLSSIGGGAPKAVSGIGHVAWQFTDVGRVPGALNKVDVNRIRSGGIDSLSGKPSP